MIDTNLVLNNKAYVKQQLEKKGFDIEYIDALKKLLLEIRKQKSALDEQNRLRKAANRDDSISPEEKRKLRRQITNSKKDFKALEAFTKSLLCDIPNLPDPDAPEGADKSGNVVIYESADYYICKTKKPLPHWDIAENLDIADTNAASMVSGSGFYMYKGKGAKLLRALISYAHNLHEDKYTEIIVPHLVKSDSLRYTGHLPGFSTELYKSDKDDLWLIPTAEVPLTAAYANSVFSYESMPRRCMGYSLAFRRESGTSGSDTRGLQRIHEFHKVELLKIVQPENVEAELMDLLDDCLKIIKALKLQYRVVDLCTGDMGDKYARCYDVEVFSPGVGKWLEVASVGHFSDYQARRAQIKYVNNRGKKCLAYTMNGSGIATPRVWLSILETYQQPDGCVKVPDVLTPFMGCEFIQSMER